ncbi:MAG: class B sortase [Eubacteriales bacterium]|nr:class B sortase [Eubacteriales bacterium]
MSIKREEKRKKSFGDALSTIIIVLALAVAAYAGYQLFNIWREYQVGVDEYKGLEVYADTERVTEGLEPDMEENVTLGDQWGDVSVHELETHVRLENMENPIDFAGLKSVNDEVIGWLEMGAIDVSYPIAQAEDNDFYLHQTIQKTYNFAGSIFVDCMNSSSFGDRNTIVYGHNMKNGSMFGMLKKYREREVFDKDPYFWIYTPDYIYKYEIFACAEVDQFSKNYQISFLSKDSFEEFLMNAKKQSQLDTGISVDPGDTVVTLSTCTGNEATRFIVQGKRVRTYRSVPKAGGYETETQ